MDFLFSASGLKKSSDYHFKDSVSLLIKVTFLEDPEHSAQTQRGLFYGNSDQQGEDLR